MYFTQLSEYRLFDLNYLLHLSPSPTPITSVLVHVSCCAKICNSLQSYCLGLMYNEAQLHNRNDAMYNA